MCECLPLSHSSSVCVCVCGWMCVCLSVFLRNEAVFVRVIVQFFFTGFSVVVPFSDQRGHDESWTPPSTTHLLDWAFSPPLPPSTFTPSMFDWFFSALWLMIEALPLCAFSWPWLRRNFVSLCLRNFFGIARQASCTNFQSKSRIFMYKYFSSKWRRWSLTTTVSLDRWKGVFLKRNVGATLTKFSQLWNPLWFHSKSASTSKLLLSYFKLSKTWHRISSAWH